MLKALRRFAKMVLDLWFMKKGLRLLSLHQKKLPMSVEEIVDSLEQYPSLSGYHLLGAMQIRAELIAVLLEVKKKNPRAGLEIGTASGGSLYCWSHYIRELLVTVDYPGGPFGGGYELTREKFYREFENNGQDLKIKFVRGQSTRPETIESVRVLLSGNNLDFLFIDGDHTLQGVFADLKTYVPFLAEGALVVLHDIEPQSADMNCQVNLLWDQIREMWAGQDIRDDGKTSSVRMGIGWFTWKLRYLEDIARLEEKVVAIKEYIM